ncbi:MAG: GDCCVxC domain-containing (seleno)protein [Patescibacteria group bacterium]
MTFSLHPSLATITCPECSEKSQAAIPTDRCQYFYICPHCKARLRPKSQDCCVFCSYGDRKCGLE